jgi:predicted DNA-binding mobile mystery protein A
VRYPQSEQSRRLLDSAVRTSAYQLTGLKRPSVGWLRTVREALNMPQRELARRLQVSQPSVQALERREADGAITLDSLERAADALGCDLVYALIPRRPLEETLRDQAQKVAQAQWNAVTQTMALENQSVTSDEGDVAELTRRTMAAGTAVWPSESSTNA